MDDLYIINIFCKSLKPINLDALSNPRIQRRSLTRARFKERGTYKHLLIEVSPNEWETKGYICPTRDFATVSSRNVDYHGNTGAK